MIGTTGSLIAIGGNEDREGQRTILRSVAVRLGGGRLLLLSVASTSPDDYLQLYREAFRDLGVEVVPVSVDDPDAAQKFADAGGLFISGGNQSRFMDLVTAELRESIRALWMRGGVVAGTSAGASVLGAVMLAHGAGDESPDRDDVDLREALGLVGGTIIDQHFAERGRIGRLVAALAQRGDLRGLGIDEDTALVIEPERMLVIGSGSVYLLDSVPPRADPPEFRLRVLAAGDSIRVPDAGPGAVAVPG
jgi:cyanophycinase